MERNDGPLCSITIDVAAKNRSAVRLSNFFMLSPEIKIFYIATAALIDGSNKLAPLPEGGMLGKKERIDEVERHSKPARKGKLLRS